MLGARQEKYGHFYMVKLPEIWQINDYFIQTLRVYYDWRYSIFNDPFIKEHDMLEDVFHADGLSRLEQFINY